MNMEMDLYIKPVFSDESVNQFARKVEEGVGGGAGSSSGRSEAKKQTSLLETIARYAKLALGTSTVVGAAAAVPGAFELGKSLVDNRETRLYNAFMGGENYDEDVAKAISSGEDLNTVLNEQIIIQEALDQVKRQARAELEENTVAAENAAKTVDDLRSVYVDTGGTLDEFNDKLASLSAKAWVDGDVTVEEFNKISEAANVTGADIERVASGLDEYANSTEGAVKKISDDTFTLGDRFSTLPVLLTSASADVLTRLGEFSTSVSNLKDLFSDLNHFDFSTLMETLSNIIEKFGGLGQLLSRILNRLSSDSVT